MPESHTTIFTNEYDNEITMTVTHDDDGFAIIHAKSPDSETSQEWTVREIQELRYLLNLLDL